MQPHQPPRLPTARAAQALRAQALAAALESPFAPVGVAGAPELTDWLAADGGTAAVIPQGCGTDCCGAGGQFVCAGDLGEPVYAWGTVEATFPSLSIEKEFFQAIDPADAAGFDPSDTLDLWRLNEIARSSPTIYKVLSRPENLFIAREMCWFLAGADDTHLWTIRPRNDQEVARLVAAIEPDQNGNKQTQLVVGRRSPIPGNPLCNGAPAITFNRLYPRTAADLVTELLAAYPSLAQAKDQVQPLVDDLLALAPGAGADGEQRALDYLLLNELDLYYQTYQLRYNCRAPNPNGFELTGLQPVSRQNGDGREQVDIVLAYQGNDTGTLSRWYYRVDVSGDFPYMVQGWRRYVVS